MSDSAYNAGSRAFLYRLEIFFDGIDNAPLVVTADNYLITADLLEETTSNGDMPYGDITANELDVDLLNTHGIFCPTNRSGPYYGRILKGVPMHAYIKEASTDWEPLGKFYVTDWKATITGATAHVTAADKLHTVFSMLPAAPTVRKDTTFKDAIERLFQALNVTANVDSTLIQPLLYAFYTQDNKALLTSLCTSAVADCYCDRNGDVVVKPVWGQRPLRAILTDDNQIVSADSEQSSSTDYDGASVTYTIPQESTTTEVLSIREYEAAPGVTEYGDTAVVNPPLYKLVSMRVLGRARITGVAYNSSHIRFTVENQSTDPQSIDIEAFGTTITGSAYTDADVGSSLLEVTSDYVQSAAYAARLKAYLQAYVNSPMPTVIVQVRGNPLLHLGDKVQVVSNYYALNFTGIIIRNELLYNGGLSGQITLIDAAALEVPL